MGRGKIDLRRPSGRGSKYYRAIVIASDPCVFCGAPSESTDHIHPTTHGGANHWTNFAPTCFRCNNKKGSLSLLGFIMNRNGSISRREAEKIKGDGVVVNHEWDNQPEMWFDPLGVIVREDKESDYAIVRI